MNDERPMFLMFLAVATRRRATLARFQAALANDVTPAPEGDDA